MSIQTLEDLEKSLSYELSWRKKELISLMSILESSGVAQHQKEVITRGGVAMLYAHWEGFIRECASFYLEFVLNRRLSYKELASNFISLGIRNRLKDIWKTKKFSLINEITEFYLCKLSEKCGTNYKDVIDTKSNLSSEVLKEITCILGIEYSIFVTKEKFIDETLLRSRNNIAHGEFFTIDIEQYKELHKEVISLLDLFGDLIDGAATNKSYLRKSG